MSFVLGGLALNTHGSLVKTAGFFLSFMLSGLALNAHGSLVKTTGFLLSFTLNTGLEGLHAKRVCPSAWWAVAPAPVPPENLHDGHRECSADKFEHSIVGTENVENVGKTHLWARRMLRMLAQLNCGHIEC